MSIRTQIAKGAGYALAPKLTYMALHPGRTVSRVASKTVDRLSPARRRRHRMRTRMTGIGAAAMAVPLGIWLGRRFIREMPDQEM